MSGLHACRVRLHRISPGDACSTTWGGLSLTESGWIRSRPERSSIPYPASLGTVTFNGTAFDFPDAASWLRTLDSDRWPAIDTGWVLSTTSGEIFDGVVVVQFSSVGTLTNVALDDRAAERIPTVPE